MQILSVGVQNSHLHAFAMRTYWATNRSFLPYIQLSSRYEKNQSNSEGTNQQQCFDCQYKFSGNNNHRAIKRPWKRLPLWMDLSNWALTCPESARVQDQFGQPRTTKNTPQIEQNPMHRSDMCFPLGPVQIFRISALQLHLIASKPQRQKHPKTSTKSSKFFRKKSILRSHLSHLDLGTKSWTLHGMYLLPTEVEVLHWRRRKIWKICSRGSGDPLTPSVHQPN